ncbi:uncharacterized protein EI90DRAFT_3045777 [Cantharellus anzutake]|uniref:uncharacterized protein n=1 Tax=Cantharellus anzutake TaxID=1750568 RepID=UPI0019033C54|nr:uncharacterized protein EI90DRAFT_3045777 [Cantharellus anzutake]KAF8336450.1 hypothetical protein EI90DRAFT_3045777 [Cantharellus anzutake]
MHSSELFNLGLRGAGLNPKPPRFTTCIRNSLFYISTLRVARARPRPRTKKTGYEPAPAAIFSRPDHVFPHRRQLATSRKSDRQLEQSPLLGIFNVARNQNALHESRYHGIYDRLLDYYYSVAGPSTIPFPSLPLTSKYASLFVCTHSSIMSILKSTPFSTTPPIIPT